MQFHNTDEIPFCRIGSGLDSDIELATLTDLWKSVKHLVRSGFNLPGFDASSVPAGDKEVPGAPNSSKAPPSPPPAVLKPRDFHSQEHERMSSPLKPYTYVLAGKTRRALPTTRAKPIFRDEFRFQTTPLRYLLAQ